jgi:Flp pilus assembly pilin Flp
MTKKTLARLSQFREDHRGASILEFALVAPVLLTLIMGTIELGYIALVRSTLESAVRDAARMGITGGTLPNMSRDAMVQRRIRDSVDFFSDDGDVRICRRSYASVANINQPEPFTDGNSNGRYDIGESYGDTNGNGQWDADMGVAGLGGPGDVVVYDVRFEMPLLFEFFSGVLGQSDRITLQSSAVARNEPWAQQSPMTSAAPPCVD